MREKIGHYILDAPLRADHSGFSRWGFGRYRGREYFVKEFLSPVYPEDQEALGAERAGRMKRLCGEYESRQRLIYQQINECSDGNLLRISEFFRYGSKYYITTKKIQALDLETVLALPREDRLRLCRSLAHSLSCLHRSGLVSGDVKLDNILFHRTPAGTVAAKLTDFDSCFWEKQPPEDPEDIAADLVYMAPETYLVMAGEHRKLDSRLDVYAMGLVFHQLLTGRLPGYETDTYEYPFQAALSGDSLAPGAELPDEAAAALRGMLLADPEQRPDMETVFRMLGGGTETAGPEPEKGVDGFMEAGDL